MKENRTRRRVVGTRSYYDSSYYVSGSLAHKPAYQPEKPRVARKKTKKVVEKPLVAPINKVHTFVLLLTFVMTISLCIIFLNTQFSIKKTNQKISSLKTSLSQLQEENMQMKYEIDSMLDLDEIYNKATNEYGMRLPKKHEVHYISLKKASYTIKNKKIKNEFTGLRLSEFTNFILKGW